MKNSHPPLLKSHRNLPPPDFDNIALVLQGGGALGSYQAGVYQAMQEAGLEPDWIAGISIGAIGSYCVLLLDILFLDRLTILLPTMVVTAKTQVHVIMFDVNGRILREWRTE